MAKMIPTAKGEILMPYIEHIVLSYRDYQSKVNEFCDTPFLPTIGIEKNRQSIINSIESYCTNNNKPVTIITGTKHELFEQLEDKIIDAFIARFLYDKELESIIESDLPYEKLQRFPVCSGNSLGFLVPADKPISIHDNITPDMGLEISNYVFLKQRKVGNAENILYVSENYFHEGPSTFTVSSKNEDEMNIFFKAEDAGNYIIPYYDGNDMQIPRSLVYKPLKDCRFMSQIYIIMRDNETMTDRMLELAKNALSV